MKVYKSAADYQNTRASVATIGTFDGVHIGHKAILERLVETAAKDDLDAVLLTFFPHPRMVLQKDSDIKLINTLSEKKVLLEQLGLDQLVVHPFTKEFSRMTAMDFVREILIEHLKIKKIIIGYDHRFGRNRNANIENLREFGETYGFEVEEINAQELDDIAVSSTKIRKALNAGDIEAANSFLGYSFMLSGTIVKGKGIGRTWNYPTANLDIAESYKLIPKNGVYVVQANIKGRRVNGITSIGTNPTVGGTKTTIETYFLDFNEDIYDEHIQLEFVTHIRDEETFESVELLKEAIKKDEVFARQYLNTYE